MLCRTEASSPRSLTSNCPRTCCGQSRPSTQNSLPRSPTATQQGAQARHPHVVSAPPCQGANGGDNRRAAADQDEESGPGQSATQSVDRAAASAERRRTTRSIDGQNGSHQTLRRNRIEEEAGSPGCSLRRNGAELCARRPVAAKSSMASGAVLFLSDCVRTQATKLSPRPELKKSFFRRAF